MKVVKVRIECSVKQAAVIYASFCQPDLLGACSLEIRQYYRRIGLLNNRQLLPTFVFKQSGRRRPSRRTSLPDSPLGPYDCPAKRQAGASSHPPGLCSLSWLRNGSPLPQWRKGSGFYTFGVAADAQTHIPYKVYAHFDFMMLSLNRADNFLAEPSQ
ncbi:hypothetical protein [Phaeodactylibacter luteus]|uniref:Uncharacterized protein n=1 Tax=Phaeodactylibacter luteus TaxID=1564516 RepID=A0A5C6S1A7_9BACT|nr:hypothetical protein [Phaeodactylibacter luteus]TXB68398.1 hypothetical protein FRY97_03195 [Phaeodactylibacter luteus]